MIKQFSRTYVNALVEDAARSSRQRQHRNVHTSYAESVQRLFNCISINSYIRPHRHSLDPKFECFVAVQGLFCLFIFSDEGKILEKVAFGTELYGIKFDVAVGVELPPGVWHTVVALAPDSVLFEVKAGPFRPDAAKEFAPWAPHEESSEGSFYLAKLQKDAECLLVPALF